MVNYWSNTNSFLPSPADVSLFFDFIIHKTKVFVISLYGFRYFGLFLPVMLLFGLRKLLQHKNYKILLCFIAPPVIHLILSAFGLYPFDLRFLLYTVPALLLVTGYGFSGLIDDFPKFGEAAHHRVGLVLIPLVFFTFLQIIGLPLKDEEIKGNLTYLENNMHPSDKLFVAPYAVPAYRYYQKTGYFNLPNEVFSEDFYTVDKKLFLEKIKESADDTWLLFVGTPDSYRGYNRSILDSLKHTGRTTELRNAEYHSDVYLLNF